MQDYSQIFYGLGIALISLLILQFVQVEMLRYTCRAQQLPKPATLGLHLSVAFCNLAMAGWLTLSTGFRIAGLTAGDALNGNFYSGNYYGGLMLAVFPDGLQSLGLFFAYLCSLSFGLQYLVYPQANLPQGNLPQGNLPQGNLAEPEKLQAASFNPTSMVQFNNAFFSAFVGTGVACLVVSIAALLLLAVIFVMTNLQNF